MYLTLILLIWVCEFFKKYLKLRMPREFIFEIMFRWFKKSKKKLKKKIR